MKFSQAKNYRLPTQKVDNLSEGDIRDLKAVISAFTKRNREQLRRLKKNESKYGVSPAVRSLRNRYQGYETEDIDVGKTLGTRALGKNATKEDLIEEYYFQRKLSFNPNLYARKWKETSLEFAKNLDVQLNENLENKISLTPMETSELYGIFDRLKESGLLVSDWYSAKRSEIAEEYVEQKRQGNFNKDEFERIISERIRQEYEHTNFGSSNKISDRFRM